MIVRRYTPSDTEAIISLAHRNFLEVNIKDYDENEMVELVASYDEERVIKTAQQAHMYVVCDGEVIVGTGSISPYYKNETECIILSVFVLPEYQGKGVGRLIMTALECDEIAMRSERIEVPASITACRFYEKMGYSFKDGIMQLGEDKLYRMEKFRLK